MIHINLLLNEEVGETSSQRKELVLVGGVLTLTLVAVLFAYFSQGTRLTAVRTELSFLENQVATIRQQNQDLEKMVEKKKEIESKVRVVHLLTSPARRAASVHILDDLSQSAPEMLWLMEFTEVKGAVKINGKAMDNQTVAAFARKLANSHYFKKVEIRETVQEKPLVNMLMQALGGKEPSPDTPPVPVTKFLVEAWLDYLPGVEEQETGKPR